MPVHQMPADIGGDFPDPLPCDEEAAKALTAFAAFVAVADGRLQSIEREAAVAYIERRQLSPTVPPLRIRQLFDESAHQLQGREFAHLITASLCGPLALCH